MRATRSRAEPTPIEEVKEVKGDIFLAVSQPMDVVSKPSLSKTATVIGKRKKKAPKVHTQTVQIVTLQALKISKHSYQDAPLVVDVALEPCQGAPSMLDVAPNPCQGAQLEPSSCKPATVTKEGKKGALKDQQPEQGLKIATPTGQDAPLLADVPREPCQGATWKKAPKARKVPKEAQPAKHDLKIAMPANQDAPLSVDVPWEPCQGATLKKAPKAPKAAQPTKQGLNVVKGSGTLKAKKSSQSKEVRGTTGTQPKAPKAPKEDQQTKQPLESSKEWSSQGGEWHNGLRATQDTDEQEKGQGRCEIKRRYGVPEQHNVKKLKKMKEVGVREVAFEHKFAIDEVKVKGHTDKGQLEKVPEGKIALKRDGMKKKAKKYVDKVLEDKEPADKALALVGSSKRPKLQIKRAKQSGASCIVSTNVMSKTSNEKLYVEVTNRGKLIRICQAEPPCASHNILMEKRSWMMQHLKKVHGLDVFIPQRLGGWPRGSANSDKFHSKIRIILVYR
ncbi:hypothetical protein L7F22_021269 [Adiantum nelumboides]|nr:hypothetical protein [Adiantum nelumboides]